LVLNIRHLAILYDIDEPIIAKLTPDIALAEALKEARRLDI